MAQWLKDNPSENYPTASAREKAFLQEVKNRSQDYLSVIAQNETQVPVSVPPDNQQGGTGSNKEVFDPNKLNKGNSDLPPQLQTGTTKIQNNGKPFTKLSDVQKLMTENLQGKDIKRLYDIDFPINELSIFRPIKD